MYASYDGVSDRVVGQPDPYGQPLVNQGTESFNNIRSRLPPVLHVGPIQVGVLRLQALQTIPDDPVDGFPA